MRFLTICPQIRWEESGKRSMSTESVARNSIIDIDGFYPHFWTNFMNGKEEISFFSQICFSISKFSEIKPQKTPFVLLFLDWGNLLHEKDDLYQNEEVTCISGIDHLLFGMNCLQPQFPPVNRLPSIRTVWANSTHPSRFYSVGIGEALRPFARGGGWVNTRSRVKLLTRSPKMLHSVSAVSWTPKLITNGWGDKLMKHPYSHKSNQFLLIFGMKIKRFLPTNIYDH